MKIGHFEVGNDHPPVFWPDIDVYFKNDLEKAKSLISQIKSAGGGFLKGALLHSSAVCPPSDEKTSYYHPDTGQVTENYSDIVARHVVSLEKLEGLFNFAKSLDLNLVLSVYDFEGVEFAKAMKADAIKIPSSNIVHKPLIEMVCQAGVPVVLDTGRSHFHEIERAVNWIKQFKCEQFLIQHSQPSPPAPAHTHHLKMMRHMGNVFQCPYGLSDHYPGDESVLAAVTLGASHIEKGLISENTGADIDVGHALPIGKLKNVLEKMKLVFEMLGDDRREYSSDYQRPRDRMGLVAKTTIEEGEIITKDHIDFTFPTIGIPVEDYDDVIGKTTDTLIEAGSPIFLKQLRK